ncbi:MAG: lipopolysaccharide assembly protein LapB [Rhodoferax sp.]|nr:lipopolysaccharide assembly protein LapB [Rhodoferax sp.]
MDFDLSWLLWALPLAFVLGWLSSRFDLRQLRMDNRLAPKAYFKGLNFLLNEQQDQAIDAFIEAVQNDPDTSELHFALGNLFRRRGEYERAVRVHQHLLSRGDLSLLDRQRAQHALALDYLKAGLIDRAQEALQNLENTPFEAQARLALLANHERSRDWVQAAQTAAKLTQSRQGNFEDRLAHYLCEQAATQLAADQSANAHALFQQATATAPNAPRPRLERARLHLKEGAPEMAFEALMDCVKASPAALPLIAGSLAESALACARVEPVLRLLQASYAQTPSLDLLDAIVVLDASRPKPGQSSRDWYVRHLEREPSLVAAAKWIAGEKLEQEQFHPQVQRALDQAVKPLTRYRCTACGFEAKQYFWHCPGCQAWDSYPVRRVEEL